MNGISHKQAVQWIHRRLDGLLNENQLLSLEEHLHSCEFCRTYATELDSLPAELQSRFHARWDEESGPSRKVLHYVTAKARKIPMSNRISSGVTLLAGAMALILLAVAINFVVSRLQSTSSATNPTEAVDHAPRAEDRLLAFASDQNGNFDIYTMHADGSGLTNLTNHPAEDSNPIWSPDGKHIAFESDRDGFKQVYIMDADGSNLARLTKDEADHGLPLNYDGKYNPWSPDGSRLAFVQEDPGGETAALYSVDVNGQNKVKLFDGKNLFGNISWSPDGNHIAFILNDSPTPRETYVPDIYIVDSDGNQLRELQSFLPEGETLAFTPYYWSSNGQSIVFTSYTVTNGPLRQTLYEFDVITNTFSNRTEIKPDVVEWKDGIALRIEVNQDAMPHVWERPDGTTKTFEESKAWGETCSLDSTRSFEGNYAFGVYCPHDKFNVYWTNADGSTIKKILTLPVDLSVGGVGDIAWSPDEQYIAFNLTTPEKTEMYVLKVQDALANPSIEPIRLPVSTEKRYGIPSWQPMMMEDLAREESTPQPPPSSGGLLAFTSNRNGKYDIYTMHADGSGLTNITNNPADDITPFWSPDGKRIAFTSNRDGSMQIYLMDADGSNVTQLTNGVGDYWFDINGYTPWSPDSRKLIFGHKSPEEQNSKLYVIDIYEKTITTLTNEPGAYLLPSWSPDGRHIAFLAFTDGMPYELLVVGSDGTRLKKLTENLRGGQFFMDDYYWSQDGETLTFLIGGGTYSAVYTATPDGSLTIVDRAGENQHILDWWNGTTLLDSPGDTLTWLRPDGSESMLDLCQNGQLLGTAHKRSYRENLFLASNCSDNEWMFYWANADGSVIDQLLESPISIEDGLSNPTWSLDDRHIAVVDNSKLYVLDVAKAREDPSIQPLVMTDSVGPSWQPAVNEHISQEIPTPQPTPTSSSGGLLAYTSNESGNYDIYTMRPDGSELTNITNHPGRDTDPVWSPDGKRIAFQSDRNGFQQIYLMDPDGLNVVQLTQDQTDHALMHYMNEFSPWSPDGTRLLISEALPGKDKWQLYALDVNEGRKTLLTGETNTFSALSWSPDGEHVALQSNDPQRGDQSRLFLVNTDGSNLREITKSFPLDEPVYTFDYHWSADGGSFFFVALFQKANSSTAYEARLDADSLIEHATTTGLVYGWWNGTYLVNNSSASAPFEWVRPDGTSSKLNPTEECEHIDLYQSDSTVKRSPNGSWVVTGQCANGDTWLYWANSDGTQIKRILDSPISITDTFLIPISWSDDDRFVVFTTNSLYGQGDLYLLNVSEALKAPSLQPVKMPNSSLPSWQPIP